MTTNHSIGEDIPRNKHGYIEVSYVLHCIGGRKIRNRQEFLYQAQYLAWFDRFEASISDIRFCK